MNIFRDFSWNPGAMTVSVLYEVPGAVLQGCELKSGSCFSLLSGVSLALTGMTAMSSFSAAFFVSKLHVVENHVPKVSELMCPARSCASKY